MTKTEADMRKEVEEITQNLFRSIYESAASDPRQWISYARSLKLAVSILRPHFDNEPPTGRSEKGKGFKPTIGPIYFLLVGFAIENYSKAVSVMHNPNVTEDGKLKRLKRHDLLGLLAEIDFDLSAEEEELVERLEQFVLWAGRYPVPTNAKNSSPKKRRQPGLGSFLIYSVNGDSTLCTNLLDRLDENVEFEMKDVPRL